MTLPPFNNYRKSIVIESAVQTGYNFSRDIESRI